MKKYQSYKSSGVEWIGEIPEYWGISKMKFENEIVSSSIDKKEHEGFEKHLIIHYNDVIKNTKIYNHNIKEFGFCSNLQYQNFKVNKGDIILTKDSMDIKNICDSTIVIDDIDNCVFGYHLYKLSTKKDKLNPLFLFYFLNNKNLKKYFLVNSNGTTIIGVSKNLLENTQIIIPPLQEQEQIVNYLEEKTTIIDKLISTKQRKVELLKEQRTTLINQVITKGLNPKVKMKDSGVEWVGEIPEGWEISKLGFYSTKIGSGSTPRGGSEIYEDSGVPFIRSQNVHFDGLRLDNVSFINIETHNSMNGSKVVKNDVLLNITGGSIGRCCIVEDKIEMNVNQHVSIIRTTNSLLNYYLNYTLSSDIGQSQVIFNLTGGNREGLTIEGIRNFRITIPPLQEQEQIVQYLDKHTKEIDDLVCMEQNKIELLKEYRQSLISEVITGKIKVV